MEEYEEKSKVVDNYSCISVSPNGQNVVVIDPGEQKKKCDFDIIFYLRFILVSSRVNLLFAILQTLPQ